MELDLSVIEAAADALGPVQAPELSRYPMAVQDVALVVVRRGPGRARRPGRRRGRGGRRAAGVAAPVRRLYRRPGRGPESLAYTLPVPAPRTGH